MNRRVAGQKNYYDGIAAEAVIERRYLIEGSEVIARRWRGLSGEIDLVFRKGSDVIFVEVKKAKDFSDAAYRLSERQLARIASAAEEFVAEEALGSLTPIRIDLALVNQHGESSIIKNVTM
ncbi:MAG: YraN family protein [Boseongicola sp.]